MLKVKNVSLKIRPWALLLGIGQETNVVATLGRAWISRRGHGLATVAAAANATLIIWSILVTASSAAGGEDERRQSFWIDLYQGEPVRYGEVVEDLAGVRVVYIGERHRLQRHHDMQTQIVSDLTEKGRSLVIGLEQMEAFQQPELDKYNRGEIDFEQLAKATGWATRWPSYQQYQPILEAARKSGAPVLALNARSETIRQVARGGGIDKLDPQVRKQLPAEIQTNDPVYEKLLNLHMMVHATVTAERLRPMVEAQIARDEMMASVLCSFLKSPQGRDRTAIVLCGAGHVSYGLGTVARVRRRLPGVKDRIIVLSESGDVKLTPAERAMARKINITHQQLRAINQPIADYLHVTSLKPETAAAD